MPENPHDELLEKLYATDDAEVWAQEFCNLYGTEVIDEGLMVAWFANSMATAVSLDRARCDETTG